jgi:phosphoribosylamine-glycine ligase
MPTPQELRKISEAAALEKSKRAEKDFAKRQEEKAKREAELLKANQEKAKAAIAHAEDNMMVVAKEGLCAALVYLIDDNEIVEYELRSLGSGAKVDSPDRYSCTGAAKMVFDHFKDTGYNVVIVSQLGPPDYDGHPTNKYYIKVGW